MILMSSSPPAARTVVIGQLVELNRRLENPPGEPPITAEELELGGAKLPGSVGATLPGRAVLIGLSWEGCVEFPYVYGRFRGETAPGESLIVPLHTDTLRKLSHRFRLHQWWGTDRGTARV